MTADDGGGADDGGRAPTTGRAGDASGDDPSPTAEAPAAEIAAVLTEPELEAWGRRLGEAATDPTAGTGVTVALHGPLGSGKTTLVRAACRGAGVEGDVRSPTFTLHNHHRPRGRRPVHHVDLYRLDGPADLDDLGWEELVDARGVLFVEWAERAGGRLPADRWEVRLEIAEDPDLRRVAARSLGAAPPLPTPQGEGTATDGPSAGGDAAGSADAGGGFRPGERPC